MSRIFLAFFMLTCGYNVFAIELPRIHLFHINGVATTEADARNNRLWLDNKAPTIVHVNPDFVVSAYGRGHIDLLYNQTHGWFLDIAWDVMGKKLKEGAKAISLDDFVKAYIEKHPDKAAPEGSPAYVELKTQIESDYKNTFFSQTNFDDVLKQFHDKVPGKFDQFKRYLASFGVTENGATDYSHDYVILLPHSQGNLYANDLYDWMTKNDHFIESHIGVVGFASPAAKYHDFYMTGDNDNVINSLRLVTVLPHTIFPLAPNTHLSTCGDGMLICHSLTETYLANQVVVDMYQTSTLSKMTTFLNDISDNLRGQGANAIKFDKTDESPYLHSADKLTIYDPTSNKISFESAPPSYAAMNIVDQNNVILNKTYFSKSVLKGTYRIAAPVTPQVPEQYYGLHVNFTQNSKFSQLGLNYRYGAKANWNPIFK